MFGDELSMVESIGQYPATIKHETLTTISHNYHPLLKELPQTTYLAAPRTLDHEEMEHVDELFGKRVLDCSFPQTLILLMMKSVGLSLIHI